MADGNVDLTALAADFKTATDEVKNLAEDLSKKYAAGAAVSQEAKDKADEALTKMNGFQAELDDLAQKAARRGPETHVVQSAGQVVASHDDYKRLAGVSGKLGKVSFEVPSMHADITSAGSSAGALTDETRVPGIITPPDRLLTVRDLLSPGSTDNPLISYDRETGFTNNAAPVSEGALKPQSEITFEEINQNVKTIAHWIRANKQILSDAKMLQSHIDVRLRYGLKFKEELQLLKGDGTGNNLEGIVTAAAAYSAPIVISGATMIDKIRLALLQAALAELPSTGTVMNPMDWAHIELTKDNEGRYIIGQPQGVASPRLWGLPVVATQAMDVDKFLCGAFKLGAQIFDREVMAVTISDEDQDNFVRNKVTLLCEERLALAIYRPEAFIYGDFGNV